eukprot:5395548-Alexandrium_andersonii.AAC.1
MRCCPSDCNPLAQPETAPSHGRQSQTDRFGLRILPRVALQGGLCCLWAPLALASSKESPLSSTGQVSEAVS